MRKTRRLQAVTDLAKLLINELDVPSPQSARPGEAFTANGLLQGQSRQRRGARACARLEWAGGIIGNIIVTGSQLSFLRPASSPRMFDPRVL